MPFLSDFKGQQLELLHSLHRLHCEFAEHKYSGCKVGITFEGLRGTNRTWETLEKSRPPLIKVQRVPGPRKSPHIATVWLTDAGHALFNSK
jgi:hypothetical protein